MGHALWSHYQARLLRMQHSLCLKRPLQIAVGIKAFPRGQAWEHIPLVGCPSFRYSPVVVTGAQPSSLRGVLMYSPVEITGARPPFQGRLLFVSTRGVSQAVYQPPSCPPAGGMGEHACPLSWLNNNYRAVTLHIGATVNVWDQEM